MHQDGQPGSVISPGSSQPKTSWQFNPDSQPRPNQATTDKASQASAQTSNQNNLDGATVTWTASEFIAHDKSSSWYLWLATGAIVLASLTYLLTRDKVPAGVVIIVAATFGFLAARKPRELQYVIDDTGIHIAEKTYPYSSFRSFSIIQEEAVESIWFMPLKRFMPPLTVYFDPDDGQKIVNLLSEFLPVENRQLDMVDRLMHRLRF